MLSTDKQTDKLTNATKNITSFAKEVTNTDKLAAVYFVHYVMYIFFFCR